VRKPLLALAALALLATGAAGQQLVVTPASVKVGELARVTALGPDGKTPIPVMPELADPDAPGALLHFADGSAFAATEPGRYSIVAAIAVDGLPRLIRTTIGVAGPLPPPVPPKPDPPTPDPDPPVPPDPPSPVVSGRIHVVLLYDDLTADAATGALRTAPTLAEQLAALDATFYALEKDSDEARAWQGSTPVAAPSVTFVDVAGKKSAGFRSPTVGGMPDAAAVVEQVKKLRGK
jgi:hypothetical protein